MIAYVSLIHRYYESVYDNADYLNVSYPPNLTPEEQLEYVTDVARVRKVPMATAQQPAIAARGLTHSTLRLWRLSLVFPTLILLFLSHSLALSSLTLLRALSLFIPPSVFPFSLWVNMQGEERGGGVCEGVVILVVCSIYV